MQSYTESKDTIENNQLVKFKKKKTLSLVYVYTLTSVPTCMGVCWCLETVGGFGGRFMYVNACALHVSAVQDTLQPQRNYRDP